LGVLGVESGESRGDERREGEGKVRGEVELDCRIVRVGAVW
jgi:hypothetical protein